MNTLLMQGKDYLINGEPLRFIETKDHGEVIVFEERNPAHLSGVHPLRTMDTEELFEVEFSQMEDSMRFYQCGDCQKVLTTEQIDDTGEFCPYCGFDRIEKYKRE